jgi:oxygen-dependent protoporphyrinogen oxidase
VGLPDRVEVAVIGAGIAGLTIGFRLARAGRAVVVLDPAPAPGGKVRTDRTDGYLIEWGPQAFLDEPEGPVRRLAADLGISGEIEPARRAARKRYVLARGRPRLVPRGMAGILSIDGLLRAMREPFVRRRARAADETLADFARRRFGREAARTLFDALASGVFAGDAARLSVRSAFPRLHALERAHGSVVGGVLQGGFKPRGLSTFRRGMGTLPEALAAALGPALALGSGALRLSREAGGFFAVEAEGGAAVRARAVVLAAPAFRAADLVFPLDPPLAALLREVPHADVAAVGLGYDQGRAFPAGPPEGFGFLAPRAEGLRTLGCLYPSSAFEGAAPPGKVLLRALAGGRLDPAAAALPDEDLVALVRREVEPILGVRAPPEIARVYRHPRGIPQYEVGHAARLAAIEARERALPGLRLAGNAYRGVAVGDVIADAERIASELLAG